jgi:hypothetical protein
MLGLGVRRSCVSFAFATPNTVVAPAELPVLAFGARLLCGLGARFVGLNVLQSERELVGIDALGSAAKPRPLKLFDDQQLAEPEEGSVGGADRRRSVPENST